MKRCGDINNLIQKCTSYNTSERPNSDEIIKELNIILDTLEN